MDDVGQMAFAANSPLWTTRSPQSMASHNFSGQTMSSVRFNPMELEPCQLQCQKNVIAKKKSEK